MTQFSSHDAYREFARAVRSRRRFLQHNAFLDALLETALSRVIDVPQDSIVWRAQLGAVDGDDGWPHAFGAKRMLPFPDRAREGRANPSGIPCLYCASDKDTAMAEVRPWAGQKVSVARLSIVRPLRIVNMALDGGVNDLPFIYSLTEEGELKVTDPPEDEWEPRVWNALNQAFSQPIVLTDDGADYAPTQMVAELFKTHGYDGLTFRSSVATGMNFQDVLQRYANERIVSGAAATATVWGIGVGAGTAIGVGGAGPDVSALAVAGGVATGSLFGTGLLAPFLGTGLGRQIAYETYSSSFSLVCSEAYLAHFIHCPENLAFE